MAALSGIHISVRDMEATLAFYRRLGLEIPDESVWRVDGVGHHVAVKVADGVSLEFDSRALTRAYDTGWQEPSGSPATVISFALASRQAVDDLYAELTAAGYRGRLAPLDAFWGARYAVVYDPDGNQVALASPSDRTYASAPPKV
jgi:catechol 2,3-dioxygenase-like lactoylglutathione lyase family enzyme